MRATKNFEPLQMTWNVSGRRRLALAAAALLCVALGASTVTAYQKTESQTPWLQGSLVEFFLPRR